MKTDWKQVLIDLRRHGVDQQQVADHLQSSGIAYTKSSVEKLSQGKVADPSHSAGQAILNLHRQIARAAGVSPSTVNRASKAGYMVTKPVRDTINGSGLVDDAIESAHSREKAELQKALAARISELQNLAADVAYEREKGLDVLNQLLIAEDMLKDERVKNKTQAESIGQCLDEIELLKRLVALRTQDLSIYQKALETTDNRADDAEYKVVGVVK